LRNRRLRRLAASAAALTLAASAAATAKPYTPPPGTPDLAKMTLRRSDLAPGPKPWSDSYEPPPAGTNLRAIYDRRFRAETTKGGVKLTDIETDINYARTTTSAEAFFARDAQLTATARVRTDLLFDLWTGPADTDPTPPPQFTLKDANFGKLHSIGIGEQSQFESVSVRTKPTTIVADQLIWRIDDMVVIMVVAARPDLADSVSIGLARTMAAHITAVLDATG
jgi:hypothetical protein